MRRVSVVVLILALAGALAVSGEAQQRNLTWTAGQVGGPTAVSGSRAPPPAATTAATPSR